MIRPYQNGLLLQTVYYANEVRDFSQINRAENERLADEEHQLGIGLIEQLSEKEFEPEKYKDEYRERVLAMVEKKIKGQEVVIPPSAPAQHGGQVIDIMQLLRKSMEKTKAQKKPAHKQKTARTG